MSKTAIPYQGDNHLSRLRDFGTDGCRTAEPHGRVTTRYQNTARHINRELLSDPVFVPAHVGCNDRIPGQYFSNLRQDPLRHHRKGVALLHLCILLFKFFPVYSDLRGQFFPLNTFGVKLFGKPD